MSEPERVEMLFLGSGAGGKILAWQMAKSGHRAPPAAAQNSAIT
jgi:choline dehydrogenase-like flavoprotein